MPLAKSSATVLGASGWIGRALVTELLRTGRQVIPVDRFNLETWLANEAPQGQVYYAIGLTADFRQHPHATVDAHVGLLSRVLQRPGVEQLLLLSSTRVYGRSVDTSETSPLPCLSSDPSDLYNLSKLMGESLVLNYSRPEMRVVRVSNVIGPSQPDTTFLGSLLTVLRSRRSVTIEQPAETTKNYIALGDVARLLPLIAEHGKHQLYNLGSAQSTSHADIARWLESRGFEVEFSPTAGVNDDLGFHPLALDRLAEDFEIPCDPFRDTDLLDRLIKS